MPRINGSRLLADLRHLASFGKLGTGVDRIAFSPADQQARAWLVERMREAGLSARIDGVANVYGEFPSVHRSVVIGSHTDSVPKGGWLDGALGVIYGLEIARSLIEAGGTPRLGVDVVSFQDEEGTFLPCLGSRSFCADVTDAEIAAAKSKDGTTLAAAIDSGKYGGVQVRRDPSRHMAYLEAHIEQGPRLEAEGRRLGVVTGIVGIRRFRILAHGQADHAGTTPMGMRKDAGAALFALASRIAAEFPRLGSVNTVWNIGSIALRPGAANVVPSEAEMVLEFRDTESSTLDSLESSLLSWIDDASRSGPVAMTTEPIARIAPTAMTPELGKVIDRVARKEGEEALFMPSGAGHDAMVLGRCMPAAMLFIPSIGGRSHDIVENTAEADIVFGCEILAGVVDALADQLGRN